MKKETKEKWLQVAIGPMCPKCKKCRMNIVTLDYTECPLCNHQVMKE